MKRLSAILIFVITVSINLFSQDIDVYSRDLNDHFKIPQIADSMSFDEFRILSSNVRLIDAAEALIVPGYIHFKLQDDKTGYALLGARLLGYGGLLFVNFHKDGLWSDVYNTQSLTSAEAKTDYYIALSSIVFIAGSYFYDWIHGRNLLEKQQQKIRFKYSLRLQPDPVVKSDHLGFIPELTFRVII